MLLALIICHLSVLVATNPFHKYPFVFLLDVGNEELEKTNSEQIRVSVPGGSVALRYPAIGNGNTIGHVRVSGIDFGTDLKASIVDGGPGYKYVVLVFMGNPGTPYDAVVTVQTMTDNALNSQNVETVVNGQVNAYQSEEDANNSAEDLSDAEENDSAERQTSIQNSNAELMQSSSKVYSYADNDAMDESDDENDETDIEADESEEADDEVYSDELASEESDDKNYSGDANNEKDIHTQYTEDVGQNYDPNSQVRGIDADNEAEDHDDEEDSSKVEPFSSKYAAHNHMSYGEEAYYSKQEFQKQSRPVYQEDPLDYEDPYAEAPIYDDEEVNIGPDKFRDSNNNNYIDSGESYAISY